MKEEVHSLTELGLTLGLNPNPLGIFTRKYPESTKIHQFCHTQNAGVLNPSESASVDILNPPKSTTNFLVHFGRFRIPCSHENLYSMLLHRIHQNLTYSTCNYNPSTKQLKTIEILNPSKSATCSMWRYPESAKIFQYRGRILMDSGWLGLMLVRATITSGLRSQVIIIMLGLSYAMTDYCKIK